MRYSDDTNIALVTRMACCRTTAATTRMRIAIGPPSAVSDLPYLVSVNTGFLQNLSDGRARCLSAQQTLWTHHETVRQHQRRHLFDVIRSNILSTPKRGQNLRCSIETKCAPRAGADEDILMGAGRPHQGEQIALE